MMDGVGLWASERHWATQKGLEWFTQGLWCRGFISQRYHFWVDLNCWDPAFLCMLVVDTGWAYYNRNSLVDECWWHPNSILMMFSATHGRLSSHHNVSKSILPTPQGLRWFTQGGWSHWLIKPSRDLRLDPSLEAFGHPKGSGTLWFCLFKLLLHTVWGFHVSTSFPHWDQARPAWAKALRQQRTQLLQAWPGLDGQSKLTILDRVLVILHSSHHKMQELHNVIGKKQSELFWQVAADTSGTVAGPEHDLGVRCQYFYTGSFSFDGLCCGLLDFKIF